jgi:UDP-2-acetamido-3-amino-2,3-dideoxy-glucuronate N-acetyltransferase
MAIYIHPTADVHADAQIGDFTKIWNYVQVREKAVIGANCVLGKDVYVDIGVRIGNNTKIQNGVSVYAGVEIEDEVFVGPGATFTNDMYPRAMNTEWQIVPTRLRRGCSIGANATVLCGVVIGAFSMVAAGAVVSVNVPPFALVSGNPARVIGFVCRQGHRMEQINTMEEKLLYQCAICRQRLSFSAVSEIFADAAAMAAAPVAPNEAK